MAGQTLLNPTVNVLPLPSIGCELRLAEVYEQVEVAAPSTPGSA